jgi:dTMP kinase
MPEQNGIFIVLEGSDGSGKGTQFKVLAERLRAVGHDIEVFDFPRYEEPSSHFVRKYLNGEYGDASEISPYTASLFYALDRYEAGPKIKKALQERKIVLSNRYVGSNMAHQGGKFTSSGEQRGFFIWEDGLEFELLGIPRPTMNIFLRVPAEVSYQLIAKKAKRSYTDKIHDQHEGNIEHLRSSIATYDTLCELFPKDFKAVDCAPEGKILSIAQINDKIWTLIKPILPKNPPNAGREVTFNLNDNKSVESFSQNTESSLQKDAIAKPESNNTGQISITIKKVSVLAVEKLQAISNVRCQVLLTEWDEDGNYNFYTPPDLSKKAVMRYKQAFSDLSLLHKKMLGNVKTSSLTALTPKAALTNVKVSGDIKAISILIQRLKASNLIEVKWLAEQLRASAVQIYPDYFKDTVRPQNVLKQDNELYKIAFKNLGRIPTSSEKVMLEEATPRNEFSLLADALYPYSSSPKKNISAELENWTYDQKKNVLAAVLGSGNSMILDEAYYKWDVLTDARTAQKLKRLLNVERLRAQVTLPSNGYDIPQSAEASGIDEQYIESFDISSKLFNELREEVSGDISEYALLSGHKNHWQLNATAQNLKDAFLKVNSGHEKEILTSMIQIVSERHPLLSRYIGSAVFETTQSETPALEKELAPKKSNPSHRRRSRKPKK